MSMNFVLLFETCVNSFYLQKKKNEHARYAHMQDELVQLLRIGVVKKELDYQNKKDRRMTFSINDLT
ncbi:hypothetical protein BD560DRAFT_54415 [Blakeslea trispora]|nr:hypothetical protein BD560DRAFT_54415 [Blakeslea trispora]